MVELYDKYAYATGPPSRSKSAGCACVWNVFGGGQVGRLLRLDSRYGNACETGEGAVLTATTMWLGCLDDAPEVRIEDKLNGTFSCSYEALIARPAHVHAMWLRPLRSCAH